MKLFSVAVALFLVLGGSAQNVVRCYTDEMQGKLIEKNPELQDYYDNAFQDLNVDFYKTSAVNYSIPVVFHIIYESDYDNISREQVLDALKGINNDYSRLNEDTVNTRAIFKSVAADTKINFVLAKKDPQGNCTDGITRTFSTKTVNANDDVKSLIGWDNTKYLNIYVVRSINNDGQPGTILGYAYKPRKGQSNKRDGILIRHDRVGTIGTASGISKGRTLTHEAGHYLNLDHPFNNGCFGGDNCDDTPPVASASNGCNLGINTCSNDFPDMPDQVENYMDYADDYCMNMFTLDQAAIMNASLGNTNSRGYLVTPANQAFTGVQQNQNLPCAPIADFIADKRLVCEGEKVKFTDLTYMGNATSYYWTFGGGTPATSTSANPEVTFNTKGSYVVTLKATNNNGDNLKYEEGYISVRAQSPVWINTFKDDFETWNIPNNNWHIEGNVGTNNKFKTTTAASVSGSKSVVLEASSKDLKEVHALVTNNINFSNSKTVNLRFKNAYASKTNAVFGKNILTIYTSIDCGKTWVYSQKFISSLIETAPATNGNFVPTASQWSQRTVNISNVAFEPNVLIKFEFTQENGNNFYLDDVMIDVALGLDDELSKLNDFKIFPNPSNGNFKVGLTGNQKGRLTLTVFGFDGRMVAQPIVDAALKDDYQEFEVDLSTLPTGMYMVQYKNGYNFGTEKIIIQ